MENNETNKHLKELVMLFSILVKRNASKATLIKEMSEVGFDPRRIAELLDTTPNTVSVTIHKLKKINKNMYEK